MRRAVDKMHGKFEVISANLVTMNKFKKDTEEKVTHLIKQAETLQTKDEF